MDSERKFLPVKKSCGILLSGGLDSAYNAFKATSNGYSAEICFIFNYGQKAWEKELSSAKMITAEIGGSLHQYDISAFFKNMDDLAYPGEIDLDDPEQTRSSMKAAWVPNRNGLMINAAATVMERLEVKYLFCGFNAEESATFRDNSAEFINAVNRSLEYSTENSVEVRSLSIDMNKEQIIRDYLDSGFPLDFIWSCYHSQIKMCGRCESCLRLTRALISNERYDEYRHIFA